MDRPREKVDGRRSQGGEALQAGAERAGPQRRRRERPRAAAAARERHAPRPPRHGPVGRRVPGADEAATDEEAPSVAAKRRRPGTDTFTAPPARGIWKGDDEPEWGKQPVPTLERGYKSIKEPAPTHPVWIVEAPRG